MRTADSMPVPTQPVVPTTATPVEKAPGILSETARRFFANRLSVLGLVVVALILGAAIFADILAPFIGAGNTGRRDLSERTGDRVADLVRAKARTRRAR